MDKFEKIIDIPSCFITQEIADKIAEKIYNIAVELANFDYIQTLKQFALQLGLTPEQAVENHYNNLELRIHLFYRKDKTIFISKYKNVEYGGRNVVYNEIPMDVEQVIINVQGIEGKFINVNTTNNLIKSFPLHDANKIIIQGYNEEFVNSLYHELSTYFNDSKKVFRDFIYRFFRPLGLLLLISLSFLELKIFSYIKPSFNFHTPLTGLSSIVVFFIFIVNYYLTFYCCAKTTQDLYHYLEFDGKISQRKKDFRWLFGCIVAAIFSGGLWAIVSTVFS